MQSTKIYDQCYNLENINIRKNERDLPVGQWLRFCLAMQGSRVRSLVWEPRSHTTRNNWAYTPQLESPRAATKDLLDATNIPCASTKTQISQVNKQTKKEKKEKKKKPQWGNTSLSIKKKERKKIREETIDNILADNNINKGFYLMDIINQKLCYTYLHTYI